MWADGQLVMVIALHTDRHGCRPVAGLRAACMPGCDGPTQARWTSTTHRYTHRMPAPNYGCREKVQTVDLRKPHQWFPVARALQRR